MKTSLKYILSLLLATVMIDAVAQNAEMADSFRADGKIYVVVAIILIVLSGLIVYLFLIDRKLTRMERTIQGKGQTKPEEKSF